MLEQIFFEVSLETLPNEVVLPGFWGTISALHQGKKQFRGMCFVTLKPEGFYKGGPGFLLLPKPARRMGRATKMGMKPPKWGGVPLVFHQTNESQAIRNKSGAHLLGSEAATRAGGFEATQMLGPVSENSHVCGSNLMLYQWPTRARHGTFPGRCWSWFSPC